jgi:hypothetical protein
MKGKTVEMRVIPAHDHLENRVQIRGGRNILLGTSVL